MRVLVIIDMQNDFTTGPLGNAECAAAIDKVVNVINTKEYDKVILTRDTHFENYLDTQEGQKLPVAHCIKDTEGWQVVKKIEDAVKAKFEEKDIMYVDKRTFGSLALGKTFEKEFTNSADTELEFVGVCTGICVISNVALAKAALPEAKISVIENACACVTPDSHKTAIEAMKTFQIDILA